MPQTKRSPRTSRSITQLPSPAVVNDASRKVKHLHETKTRSCKECSGLFIHEHIVGICFSGFVMRCVNGGATEYLPVGPW